jgi:hypothetical protein
MYFWKTYVTWKIGKKRIVLVNMPPINLVIS